jgi:L-rhamnonate dehydratase
LNAFQRRAVFIEFNTSQGPLSRQLVKRPLTLTDGYLDVPNSPGLGVEVDERVIEKYRIA